MKNKQKGFAAVELLIILAVLALVAGTWWLVFNKKSGQPANESATNNTKTADDTKKDEITKLKSIGFNLDYYDPATKRAGDFKFQSLGKYTDLIWVDFGIQDSRSPNDPTKRNVQPTFILPLGTKVLSLVDGEVTNVEQLYSGDYSVMVKSDNKNDQLVYETEHVNNPIVKKGDRVKGGQVIAEVSTHDSQYHPGLGILEIGILRGGNPPEHLCPFDRLDDSIKEETYKKITALYKSWEEFTGKDLYKNESYPVPGCATLEPAAG